MTVAVLALTIALASCGKGEDPNAAFCNETLACCTEPSGETSDPAACTNFVVPNRLGYRWDKLNHRISNWEFEHRPADQTCRADELYGNFIGGDFSTGEIGQDTPEIKYTGQPVSAADSSQFGAARVQVEATIGPDGRVEMTESFARDELNLRNYPCVVAIIEGFSFDTSIEQSEDYPENYDASHGYTSRGFGASANVTATDDSSIELTWGLRFEIGASPDREDHNEAIEHARVGGEIDVLLIGVADKDLLHTASKSYTLDYPEPEPLDEQTIEPATEEQQRLEITGTSGAGAGFHGFSSFDFLLSPDEDGTCANRRDCSGGELCMEDGQCEELYGPEGYYVRELTVDMTRSSYDDASGQAVFMVDGFASNSTTFIAFNGLRSTFEADVAWIQGIDAPEPIVIDETFETGETSHSLE
ncbi:MAG: hypothetical protein ACQEVA_07865 [Myxococcota bacterium]